MPVPDNTHFGVLPEGKSIRYGEARKILDEQRQLQILKSRLDSFLINQINELGYSGGVLKVYSPFPLTVLCLLSIETLGHVICDIEKIKAENEHEQSKNIVTPVYHLMDGNLIHKPTKKFYDAFQIIHGTDDKKSIKRYSDVIHKYQRNTFTHGYQSRGVYLTEDISEAVRISEGEGCLYINPYSFWDLFKKTYEDIFSDIISNEQSKYRNNALKYFQRLLQ